MLHLHKPHLGGSARRLRPGDEVRLPRTECLYVQGDGRFSAVWRLGPGRWRDIRYAGCVWSAAAGPLSSVADTALFVCSVRCENGRRSECGDVSRWLESGPDLSARGWRQVVWRWSAVHVVVRDGNGLR